MLNSISKQLSNQIRILFINKEKIIKMNRTLDDIISYNLGHDAFCMEDVIDSPFKENAIEGTCKKQEMCKSYGKSYMCTTDCLW